jgi:hypothetical protein
MSFVLRRISTVAARAARTARPVRALSTAVVRTTMRKTVAAPVVTKMPVRVCDYTCIFSH